MWCGASAFVIALCLTLVVACGDGGETARTEQTPSQPEVAGSESELVRFVQRLFDVRYPGAPEPGEVRILAGQLPEDLPTELAMPRDAEVVGSVARGDQSVEIILDVPGEPQSVLDAYGERLVAAGWREPKLEGPSEGGFVPADGAFANAFCREEGEPYMTVSAFSLDNGDMSDVRLSLNSGPQDYSPCAQSSPGGPPMTEGLIPRLEAPRDARMTEGGEGGGGSDSWYSSSTLETAMSVADLEEHYRDQLEAAGWNREDRGASGPVAWSTWTFTDDGDRWSGVFLALDVPGEEDGRFVYVRIQRPGGAGAGTPAGSAGIQFISP
jgi:hypothetical protein